MQSMRCFAMDAGGRRPPGPRPRGPRGPLDPPPRGPRSKDLAGRLRAAHGSAARQPAKAPLWKPARTRRDPMLLWAMRGLTAKTSAGAGGARHFARARSSRISVGRDHAPCTTGPHATRKSRGLRGAASSGPRSPADADPGHAPRPPRTTGPHATRKSRGLRGTSFIAHHSPKTRRLPGVSKGGPLRAGARRCHAPREACAQAPLGGGRQGPRRPLALGVWGRGPPPASMSTTARNSAMEVVDERAHRRSREPNPSHPPGSRTAHPRS
ncbi:MAG: hypothetical protein RL071_745 [Pseudomonadota bacterium]